MPTASREGPIPIDEALPIARQIAEALEAAHEQGIVHRDLKPANIKVRPDGTVKVLDFGLAKATEPVVASSPSMSRSPTITTPAMTQAGIILGTAAYMSPEQARGKVVDKRADIWAFGAVLYEMLTGRRAFPGDDVAHARRGHDAGPAWAALPQATTSSIRHLLRRCLVKDPRQRIRDMGDVRLALEGANDPAPAPNRQTRPLWVWALRCGCRRVLGIDGVRVVEPACGCSEAAGSLYDSASVRSGNHLLSGHHARRPDRGVRRATRDR